MTTIGTAGSHILLAALSQVNEGNGADKGQEASKFLQVLLQNAKDAGDGAAAVALQELMDEVVKGVGDAVQFEMQKQSGYVAAD